MSYQVLARKWRPRTFAELSGQGHVVQALTNALTRGRLHHAYLLTGTRGVGKTTIARILAKSLNCATGVTATPCGACPACTDIDAGRFVDLLELDAASNTGVDDMREILDNARYAPTVGRYKVYLIDEVHMLSKNAFNSMLKTLEEPPEHVKFVLATTDPQKIPVTVLSRCLQFNLKPLSQQAIVARLAEILAAEGIAFDEPALALVARGAAGSMRDGLSLLDQAIAYGDGEVREAVVREMLGAIDTRYVYRIAAAVMAGDGPALLAEADAMAARAVAFEGALDELASLWHRVAVAQAVPAAAEAFDDAESVAELARGLSPELVQLAYQIAVQGRADLALAPDPATGFAMTLLRLRAFAPAAGGNDGGTDGRFATGRSRNGAGGGAPGSNDAACRRPASGPGDRGAARTGGARGRGRGGPGRSGRGRAGGHGRRRLVPGDGRLRACRGAGCRAAHPADGARELAGVRGCRALPGHRGPDRRAERTHPRRRSAGRAGGAGIAQASGRPEVRRQAAAGARAGLRAPAEARVRGRRNGRCVARRPGKARTRRGEGEDRGRVPRRAVRPRRRRPFRREGPSRFRQARFVTAPRAAPSQGVPPMMKNQLAGLMKQAQQMQEKLAENQKRVEEELARTEVEGQAGAGLVKVTMTCKFGVKRVAIDPTLLGEERDMLEDLVAAAFNDAVRRAEATGEEKRAGLAAGLNLPAGMGLPPGFKLPF